MVKHTVLIQITGANQFWAEGGSRYGSLGPRHAAALPDWYIYPVRRKRDDLQDRGRQSCVFLWRSAILRVMKKATDRGAAAKKAAAKGKRTAAANKAAAARKANAAAMKRSQSAVKAAATRKANAAATKRSEAAKKANETRKRNAAMKAVGSMPENAAVVVAGPPVFNVTDPLV